MATPRHRISVAVAHAHAELDTVTDASVWSMTPEETRTTLVEITRLKARAAELEARVAEHADDQTLDTWAHQTRQLRPAVLRTTRLGRALVTRSQVRAALAAGDLVVEQAQVIVDALDQLPADLDPGLVDKAERHLVAEARDHDARVLRLLGTRLLEVVAPDLVDAYEAEQLAREEADALVAAKFKIRDDGHGKCHGTFTIPSFHGAALTKMLLAFTNPKHRTATEGAGAARRPGPQALGRALCELIERIGDKDLPSTGGVGATVVVTIPLAVLEERLQQACLLDTGGKISPALARRLACEAGLLPVVLGGKSQVLDLGRKRRFHTRAQRIAIALRDQRCTEPGCDWPPAMCHTHHDLEWAHGGPTDVDHARLLCPRHHARYHRRT
ncbi:HNH endonuclease signature motif containing protein [Nocardioides aquiterrae]|uniref:HNH endonuclease signature motif containing protein n=1 Tax=Nocardioides aquiterrae TaxID=203799 RepID=A0ABN1UEJ9_9ACTN